MTVLLSCFKAKIASVQLLSFLKPICAWLRNSSTLHLARCSRTLADILPLYIPQSPLLPFLFHIGAMTARCQSSGAFLSIHAFWKMEVSQVMPISRLARIGSVVIPSIPGLLFLGLFFFFFFFCLLDVRSDNDWLLIVVFVVWVELGLVLLLLWVLFNSSLKYYFHLVLILFLSLMGLPFFGQ